MQAQQITVYQVKSYSDLSMWCDGVDQLSVYPSNVNCFMHDELDTSANVINFWDAEGSTPVYIRLLITDVQGCLK